VKSVLWRQADEFGVVYTEDREHLRRLLSMGWFPVKREEDAATYKNRRGRVFAWQATFDLSLWNRVVRALGRQEIEIRLEEEPRARKRRTADLPPPPATLTTSTPAPRAASVSPVLQPAAPPTRRPARATAASSSPAAAAQPARERTARAPRSADLPAGESTDPRPHAPHSAKLPVTAKQSGEHPVPAPLPEWGQGPLPGLRSPAAKHPASTRAPRLRRPTPTGPREPDSPTGQPAGSILSAGEGSSQKPHTPARQRPSAFQPAKVTAVRPSASTPDAPSSATPPGKRAAAGKPQGSPATATGNTSPARPMAPRVEKRSRASTPPAKAPVTLRQPEIAPPLPVTESRLAPSGPRTAKLQTATPEGAGERPPRPRKIAAPSMGAALAPRSGKTVSSGSTLTPCAAAAAEPTPRSTPASQKRSPLPPSLPSPESSTGSAGSPARATSNSPPPTGTRSSSSPAKRPRSGAITAKDPISPPAATRERAGKQEVQPPRGVDLPDPARPTRRRNSTAPPSIERSPRPSAVQQPGRSPAGKRRALGSSAPEPDLKTAGSSRATSRGPEHDG